MLGIVIHTYNTSAWEPKAEGSGAWSKLHLPRKFKTSLGCLNFGLNKPRGRGGRGTMKLIIVPNSVYKCMEFSKTQSVNQSISKGAPAGIPWECSSHPSQGSRWVNCWSSPLPSLLQTHSPSLIPSSVETTCSALPVPISSGSHRSPFQTSFLSTHCFIPVPSSSRHSMGTY